MSLYHLKCKFLFKTVNLSSRTNIHILKLRSRFIPEFKLPMQPLEIYHLPKTHNSIQNHKPLFKNKDPYLFTQLYIQSSVTTTNLNFCTFLWRTLYWSFNEIYCPSTVWPDILSTQCQYSQFLILSSEVTVFCSDIQVECLWILLCSIWVYKGFTLSVLFF